MTRRDTINGLKYITQSPPHEHGGFHPYAVAIAKSALKLITKRKNNNRQQ